MWDQCPFKTHSGKLLSSGVLRAPFLCSTTSCIGKWYCSQFFCDLHKVWTASTSEMHDEWCIWKKAKVDMSQQLVWTQHYKCNVMDQISWISLPLSHWIYPSSIEHRCICKQEYSTDLQLSFLNCASLPVLFTMVNWIIQKRCSASLMWATAYSQSLSEFKISDHTAWTVTKRKVYYMWLKIHQEVAKLRDSASQCIYWFTTATVSLNGISSSCRYKVQFYLSFMYSLFTIMFVF